MGQRGESWVLMQAILLALLVFAPGLGMRWPGTPLFPYIGWALVTAGLAFLIWSAASLGRSLTPFPRPLAGGRLVTGGAYRLVRHPIYSAVLLMALGFSLATMNEARLLLTLLLFIFFDRKSRVEEKWLEQQYPDYATYRQRTKRLIPGIY